MNGKIILIGAMLAAQIFSGCGDSAQERMEKKISESSTQSKLIDAASKKIDLSRARDGTYTVESSLNENHGHSELTLEIRDHKIVSAEFIGIDLNGAVKDEDYGATMGKDSGNYKKAQVAVKAIKTYPAQLVETQDLSKVDAISGASISYSQFVETVKRAVDAASDD